MRALAALRANSLTESPPNLRVASCARTSATIVSAIERLLQLYLELREDGERFLDTYNRVGMEGFKEAIYA